MAEFFHMGGYGFFVWSCFGISAVVLIFNVVMPLIRHRQIKREIKGQLTRAHLKNNNH